MLKITVSAVILETQRTLLAHGMNDTEFFTYVSEKTEKNIDIKHH